MRADAAANRQRILTIARRLIKSQNFNDITMAQIAQQAKVGIGTLYRNFPTKNELYLAVLYGKISSYIKKENEYLDSHPINLTTVKHVLNDYLDFREVRLSLFQAVAFETARDYYQRQNYQSLIELFSRLLQAYKKLPAAAALFQADALAAVLRSDSYYYQREGRKLTKGEILTRLLQLFFNQK